jgi:trimethyllysine dioxygenase
LRDHCRCPQCFHPITKQRLVDTFEVSVSSIAFIPQVDFVSADPAWDYASQSRIKTRRPWGYLYVESPILVRWRLMDVFPGPSSHSHTSFYPWSWLREHSYDPRQKSLPVQEFVPN